MSIEKGNLHKFNKHPVVLLVLDGWGINNAYNGNAITQAKIPTYDYLWKNYSHTKLEASGNSVGLPKDQDGNSESGHLNLGAGRIVDQDTLVITKAIQNGTFFKNPAFLAVAKQVRKTKGSVHLMGLLTGWQSAHADPGHLVALVRLFRQLGIKKVYLHLFTDGRDSFKYGALKFLKQIKDSMQDGEQVATIMGRYYAMDRKKEWSRTEKAYEALVNGKAIYYARSAEEAIQSAYDRGETDEFVAPTVIVNNGVCDETGVCVRGTPVAKINDGDGVIFFNLRSDRARELTKAFVQKDFNGKNPGSFKRSKTFKNLLFVAMTDFGPDLDNVLSAFPSLDVRMTLPMVLKDFKQLYLSEAEKYAHVTYFFNGGYADPVGGEERIMIPSPDVSSYDLKPEMSAYEVSDVLLKYISKNIYDFYTVNFANPDMVGHTGNLAAGIKACEAVDVCLNKIYQVVKNKKGVLIITADHGNVEEMIDMKTGEVDTQHSMFPVPFIIVDHRGVSKINYNLRNNGVLGSVAPTILDLMGLIKPTEMTEKSLILK